MAAQIIPADDTLGAREVRVVYFIDRTLTTFDREKQANYTQGLKDLQVKTRELFANKSKFSDLTSEQQIQLLTRSRKASSLNLSDCTPSWDFLPNPNTAATTTRPDGS